MDTVDHGMAYYVDSILSETLNFFLFVDLLVSMHLHVVFVWAGSHFSLWLASNS